MNEKTREFPTATQIRNASGVNFKIIVPSTRDKNIYIGKLAWAKRVQQVNNFVASKFGGSTSRRAVGNYLYRGKVIQEKVVIVQVFTTQEQYNIHDEVLRDFIKQKKKSWGQDTMAFEYQDKLYLI